MNLINSFDIPTARARSSHSGAISSENSQSTNAYPGYYRCSNGSIGSNNSLYPSPMSTDVEKLIDIPLPPPPIQQFPPSATNKEVDKYLDQLADAYQINRYLVDRLHLLEEYEIVILCDDSGSMNVRLKDSNKTRWQELKEVVQIILRIGTVFDENGVDVYFLNRPALLNVTDPKVIDEAFAKRPAGFSRLARALSYIFKLDAAKPGGDKKLLVFVATDAEPTNADDKIDLSSLEKVMTTERQVDTTHVMFLLCSDKPECFRYLSKWDEEMDNVDVTVDFEREKRKIIDCQGASYPFSFGDYIVKALLGAIDPEMDHLNEHEETVLIDE